MAQTVGQDVPAPTGPVAGVAEAPVPSTAGPLQGLDNLIQRPDERTAAPRATGRRPGPPAAARAIVVGAAAAALMLVLRLTGVVDGLPALIVAILLALAIPTSRLLARRVLIAGALAFGAAPALWALDLPVGPPGRMTWSLALAAGGLAGWVAWPDRAGRAARARRVLVRPRAVDGVPALALVASAAVTAPWWRVADPARALAMLAPGWDNSAHLDMAAMIRRYGVTVSGAPDPIGGHWAYAQYPQGFHSAAVAVMELLAGPQVGTVRAELVTSVHAFAWLLVAVTTMLVAGLAALPWARRNPWLLVPAALAVVVVMTLFPGGQAFVGGFPNFTVAAGLTGCVVLLVATMPRLSMPLHVAAVVALVVAVAHGWLLLLAIAGPATLVLLRRRSRRAARPARQQTAVVLALGLAGLVDVALSLGPLDPGTVLVIPGGMVAHDPRIMAAVALVAPCVALLLALRYRGLARLAVAPVAGLLAAVALGVFQTATAGALSYYFWKLLLGVEIVGLVVIAAVWTRVTASWHLRSRAIGPAVAVLGVGVLVLSVRTVGVLPDAGGIYAAQPAWTASAEIVLRAADEVDARPAGAPGARWTILTEPGSTFHRMSAEQWLLALTGQWTAGSDPGTRDLLTLAADGDVVGAARRALAADPGARIVAPPELAVVLQAALGADADRVVTWG